MKPMAEKALQAVQDGEICIIPNRFEKVIKLFPNSGDFFLWVGRSHYIRMNINSTIGALQSSCFFFWWLVGSRYMIIGCPT
jgi:hypothetical protein